VKDCTYLLKSRHGVYYFRAVLSSTVRSALGSTRRELRISLRTKDKTRAKTRVARKAFLMNYFFNELAPWEQDAERRKALYWHGIKMLERFGEVDLDDEFDVGALTEEIGSFDLEAYLFVREQKLKCEQVPEGEPQVVRPGEF
jgi:hypothetical protein